MAKKLISFVIILSMIVSLSSVIGFGEEYEVLTRITFDKKNETWSQWSAAGEKMMTVTNEGYTEGKKGLLIVDDDTAIAAGIITESVPVVPGENYTGLADVYVVSGHLSLSFKYCNAEGKAIASNTSTLPKGKWINALRTRVAPEGAATVTLTLLTGNEVKCVAVVDNIRIVKGAPEAATVEGKLPEKLPIPEEELNPQPVEDGIPEGTVVYRTSFEEDFGEEYGFKGAKEFVDCVTQVEDDVTDGKKAVRIVDTSKESAPGFITKMIPISAGNNYAFTMDTKLITGIMKMHVNFYDVAKQKVLGAGVSFSGSGAEWKAVNHNVTAPLDAKYVQILICGNVVSVGDAYIDNFRITKGFVDELMLPRKSAKFIPPSQVPAADATLVAPVDNKLQYSEFNEYGDKIGDYSYAGFYAGEYNLPDTSKLPVALTLSPTGTGDDTQFLQDAIDKVAAESPDTSMKVIKLKTGRYYVKKPIFLKSGIILSGEGQGPNGTIIYASEPAQYMVIYIYGEEPVADENKINIIDDYVPAGRRTFTVEDASTLKVGDVINVVAPGTEEWAQHVEMAGLKNTKGGDNSWGGKVNMITERTISAINGNEITIDNSVFVPLPKNLGPCYIEKVDESKKIENAGVENLRIEAYYKGVPGDEAHATSAVAISNAKNIFVRDITSKYFINSVVSSKDKAKQVTALNCSSVEPVSSISGSRRYSFACSTSCQQILYAGCYSHAGRHDYETSLFVTGPIVFLDSVADASYGGIETHGTWATGILYDNVYSITNSTTASIGIKNNGLNGSTMSQGWTGANSIIWNSLAPALMIHKPPHPYQNFVVGSWGIYKDPEGVAQKQVNIDRYAGIYRKTSVMEPLTEEQIKEFFATKEGSPYVGDGYVENEFTPVNPRSLFKAQLSERFTGVISNARPNAPTIVNPKYDRFYEKNSQVTVDGFAQLGASKVTVYIDDEPYNATLDKDSKFEFTKELSEGVHKIYVTQVIDGVEGVKSPDRFIIVGKFDDEYPAYLSSTYDLSKTSFLTNDPRPTYDVYQNEVLNNKIKVLVNGAPLKSDVEPFETNGRVLVPMRAIFEALSAEVSWDENTATATATKGETVVKITENKTTTYVNNAPYELDVPATILNGRFVVPVRFISESFGCKVDWVDETKTVVITSK